MGTSAAQTDHSLDKASIASWPGLELVQSGKEELGAEAPQGQATVDRQATAAPQAALRRNINTLYVLADICALTATGFAVLGVLSRYPADWPAKHIAPVQALTAMSLYLVVTVLFCGAFELYEMPDSMRPLERLFTISKPVMGATLVVAIPLVFLGLKPAYTGLLFVTAVADIATLSAWRWWHGQRRERALAAGAGIRHVLLIGSSSSTEPFRSFLASHPELGYEVKAFFDELEIRSRGAGRALEMLIRSHFIDEIFIVCTLPKDVLNAITWVAHSHRVDVKIVPEVFTYCELAGPMDRVGHFPVLPIHAIPVPHVALWCKRVLDVVLAGLALVLCLPLFALIALAIKLDSPGPVFYCANRVGKKARRFRFYKFRSMVADAEKLKAQLEARNEREGPFFKITNDPRITRVGAFLRKTSLDELPQLWNVVKGDMSIVGPRPHPVDDFEKYGLDHLQRLQTTPGITGLWQVTARHDPSFEKSMALDLEYIRHWSLALDFKLMLQTVPVLFKGMGR